MGAPNQALLMFYCPLVILLLSYNPYNEITFLTRKEISIIFTLTNKSLKANKRLSEKVKSCSYPNG